MAGPAPRGARAGRSQWRHAAAPVRVLPESQIWYWIKRCGPGAGYLSLAAAFLLLGLTRGWAGGVAPALGFYAALVLATHLLQELAIFAPIRGVRATPESLGLDFERFAVRTSDGETIRGWFVPGAPDKPTVLFCHGNSSTISSPPHLAALAVWNSLGLSCAAFDYRGFGHSSGLPSERGTYLDAEAVWRYLVRNRSIPPREIVIWGRSLGGGPASHLALREPRCRMLVLESTFISMHRLVFRKVPLLPTPLILRIRYPVRERVRRLRCPLLVMHSPQDETVPFSHGAAIYRAASGPKRFVQLCGGHNLGFLRCEDRYREAVASSVIGKA
jgi:pimeloyl-ACP methyl ester carboxylesterase